MSPLEVLLVESRPGAAAVQVESLERAGHRVHRCHDRDANPFPCRAVSSGQCPLDDGIDVGLVVRARVRPRPTEQEHAVSCILAAGVPLVEDGSPILDPYEPHLSARVEDDVVATCEAVGTTRYDPVRVAALDRMDAIRIAAGVAPGALSVGVSRREAGLVVEIEGPDVPPTVRSAMAVRAFDAVRASGDAHTFVDVSYRVR